MRSSGASRGHSPSSKAVRAACTARSMSAVVPSGTRPTTSSVWGEMTSMTSEPAGSTHSPPMNSFSWTCITSPSLFVQTCDLAAGDLAGPRVVGLAAGGADDLGHEVQLLGHLVAGDVAAAVAVELVEGRGGAVARLHDRGDPLAPALVGHADDDGVEHGRVRLERGLDLLGEDLLAAGVDALRAAAEQRDRAVGLVDRHVAGQRVAHAARAGDEGGGRLLGVLVVLERDVAAAGEPALLAGARARSR